jgi:hypothetical protein
VTENQTEKYRSRIMKRKTVTKVVCQSPFYEGCEDLSDLIQKIDPGFFENPFSRSVEMQCFVRGISDGEGNLSGFFVLEAGEVRMEGVFEVSGYLMTYQLELRLLCGMVLVFEGMSVLPAVLENYRQAEIQNLLAEQIQDESNDRGCEGDEGCNECRCARVLLDGDWENLDPQDLGQITANGLTPLKFPITEEDHEDPLSFVLSHMDLLPETGSVISIPDAFGSEFGGRLELTKAELRQMAEMLGITK